ncbi:kinesin-like protein KIN-12F [Juglans microcarpa x Juglans regia]|uniref:kinesin-like protein KIN-12F n=1 Tax=Juglans microcarpa x Juglans regia TaxID=2249226 RepID=UPI001B7E9AE1|nr:kinesin-like protein KIN-12F [Juglans microcarpa x Juglans regia]
MKSNQIAETTETRFLGTISASSIGNLLPRSISKHKSNSSNFNLSKFNAENAPPTDPNIQTADPQAHLATESSPSKILTSRHPIASEARVPLAPSVTDEIVGSDGQCEVLAPPDPPVKVVVRIRPDNGGDRTVKKVSLDTLSVGDRKFTFDSVFDSNANQEDVFQLVGVPLVRNALAGYNTSILSCGQTGSGKTYTMWGPPSAMVEDPSASSRQGIVPRIFQMLFSEIQREQENSEEKHINYQCRCSFLEIYNERIGDLLDPMQRNLEMKDDGKNGLYIENLTEEYVTSYEDVTQILIKGLSSRKVGATSLNSKSSRSHILFTFSIESWRKGTSSECFNSSKASRICLVDLAGLDRNKGDDVGRQVAREGKHLKRSLSKLGHLVNILAEGAKSGKSEDVSYGDSCLTNLLQESFGGNAKLTVICAISPENKNSCDTLRTLRFGQRVKFIRNEPVINEITEDDVNDLSDQIRQLKEELIRAKSNVRISAGSQNRYFQEQNVRESLNQLRVSLNRSLILNPMDNDSDEEMNVDEDDISEIRQHLDKLHNYEEDIREASINRDSIQFYSMDESSETDSMDAESEIKSMEKPWNELLQKANDASEDNFASACNSLTAVDLASRGRISISSCCQSPVLQDPMLSESPKIGNSNRKSMNLSSHLGSQNCVSESSKFNLDVLRQSLKQGEQIKSSMQSSKTRISATETLAASLQRGLQIIDCHQRNSAINKSLVSFSFEHLRLKPCPEVDKANASVQALPEEKPSSNGPSVSFLCASCQQRIAEKDSNGVHDSLRTWIAVVDEEENPSQLKDEDPKDAGNTMRKSSKRMVLENVCLEQAAKIEQLNLLVEQYKREKEEVHNQVSNTLSLDDSENERVSFKDTKNNDSCSRKDEALNKLLRCNAVETNQPEVIKEKFEVKEILEPEFGNRYFDLNEKEALLKEIERLKGKLQSSSLDNTEILRSSMLSRSMQLRKSGVDNLHSKEELELERETQKWTEMESDWISLTDELRIDLESHRRRAEQVEMELSLEKKCTEELDDALHRAVLGHARMVEHYAELQEKYNDLAGKHRAITERIAEVKRAAAKVGKKGPGSRFAKSLVAEFSSWRVKREREREMLKKENKSLRIQLRDTAEAVHAAGELLARLREAEQAASVAEENFTRVQEDNEKLKKQMEKLKRKHETEMITMKKYLAESRLPESALQPLYQEDSDVAHNNANPRSDQAWRSEFGAIYK